MSNIIEQLEQEQMRKDIPEFAPGDTVTVQVKVKEGNRERLQAFEGVVIAKRNRGLNSAFTVRKISWRRRGTCVPDTQCLDWLDQGQASGRCATRQAVLPARAVR